LYKACVQYQLSYSFKSLDGRACITFLSLYQSIPYEAYKGILFVHKDPHFCTQRYSFVPTSSSPFSPIHLIIPLLLHSSLPHSTNATCTYNSLGIISFHKDGVLTGSRMLCEGRRLKLLAKALQSQDLGITVWTEAFGHDQEGTSLG
jgi:hypothetical protein